MGGGGTCPCRRRFPYRDRGGPVSDHDRIDSSRITDESRGVVPGLPVTLTHTHRRRTIVTDEQDVLPSLLEVGDWSCRRASVRPVVRKGYTLALGGRW